MVIIPGCDRPARAGNVRHWREGQSVRHKGSAGCPQTTPPVGQASCGAPPSVLEPFRMVRAAFTETSRSDLSRRVWLAT